PWLAGPYLQMLAVLPTHQNHGIGGRLLAWFEDEARLHFRNLWLCVSAFNIDAQRFYARHGYVHLATLHDLMRAGDGELRLRKRTVRWLPTPPRSQPQRSMRCNGNGGVGARCCRTGIAMVSRSRSATNGRAPTPPSSRHRAPGSGSRAGGAETDRWSPIYRRRSSTRHSCPCGSPGLGIWLRRRPRW